MAGFETAIEAGLEAATGLEEYGRFSANLAMRSIPLLAEDFIGIPEIELVEVGSGMADTGINLSTLNLNTQNLNDFLDEVLGSLGTTTESITSNSFLSPYGPLSKTLQGMGVLLGTYENTQSVINSIRYHDRYNIMPDWMRNLWNKTRDWYKNNDYQDFDNGIKANPYAEAWLMTLPIAKLKKWFSKDTNAVQYLYDMAETQQGRNYEYNNKDKLNNPYGWPLIYGKKKTDERPMTDFYTPTGKKPEEIITDKDLGIVPEQVGRITTDDFKSDRDKNEASKKASEEEAKKNEEEFLLNMPEEFKKLDPEWFKRHRRTKKDLEQYRTYGLLSSKEYDFILKNSKEFSINELQKKEPSKTIYKGGGPKQAPDLLNYGTVTNPKWYDPKTQSFIDTKELEGGITNWLEKQKTPKKTDERPMTDFYIPTGKKPEEIITDKDLGIVPEQVGRITTDDFKSDRDKNEASKKASEEEAKIKKEQRKEQRHKAKEDYKKSILNEGDVKIYDLDNNKSIIKDKQGNHRIITQQEVFDPDSWEKVEGGYQSIEDPSILKTEEDMSIYPDFDKNYYIVSDTFSREKFLPTFIEDFNRGITNWGNIDEQDIDKLNKDLYLFKKDYISDNYTEEANKKIENFENNLNSTKNELLLNNEPNTIQDKLNGNHDKHWEDHEDHPQHPNNP